MDTMKIFYDFEFKESKGKLDVISGGFVREDGRELYFVLDDFDTDAVLSDWWLMKNVMSSIKHEVVPSHVSISNEVVKELIVTDENLVSRSSARIMLLDFTNDIIPEWWAWYGAYDHVSLCSIMGRMVDLPKNWPMYTLDLKQLHRTKGYCDVTIKQAPGKHNALEDARFNVERYNFLLAQPDSTHKKHLDKTPVGIHPFEDKEG